MSLTARLLVSTLLFLSGCATPGGQTGECRTELPSEAAPGETNLVNAISVVPVKDFDAAVSWYGSWLGRAPDVAPAEGVAEWQLVGDAWLQVALDPEHAGGTTVVVGVKELVAQRAACEAAGIPVGDTQDYGVVKLAEVADPDGNKVAFVEQVSGG